MRAARDPLGEGFAQRSFNSVHHGISVGHHFACPKSYHAKIIATKPSGTPQVVSYLRYITMLAAVYFDHQPSRQADEIGKEWPQRKLTTKAQSIALFLSQQTPELLFGLGCVGAKLASTERPPPPNNRLTRLFAPSRQGRGKGSARTFAIAWHHSNTAPRPRIKS